MSTIPVGKENSTSIDLHYEDHGTGQPVVLIHGWPLSGAAWEKQVPALLAAGHRVITYDRRGFGRSSQPASGYDYDTFAADLDALLTRLDLENVVLVGFSMGGGEVARYLGKHGAKRVSKAAFLGAITPYLKKAADNAGGVDGTVFDGIQKGLRADRPAFLTGFFRDFYNVDQLGGKAISDEALRLSWNIAMAASPIGTIECVTAWGTDFRADLRKIDVPTLIMHGDDDQIVPIDASARLSATLVKGSVLKVYPGFSHGMCSVNKDQINADLLAFIAG